VTYQGAHVIGEDIKIIPRNDLTSADMSQFGRVIAFSFPVTGVI
jgi:hypothetical protein